MMLSDNDIRAEGANLVQPFNPDMVQPASIDLTLGEDFLVPDPSQCVMNEIYQIDLDSTPAFDITVPEHKPHGLLLLPQKFVLGATAEKVTVPDNLSARIEGKSSLGRLGLIVHVTAGFIDPGFKGNLTLEFYNLFPIPILLKPGKPICQVSFTRLLTRCSEPYNGRYQGDEGVAASRYGKEIDRDGSIL